MLMVGRAIQMDPRSGLDAIELGVQLSRGQRTMKTLAGNFATSVPTGFA